MRPFTESERVAIGEAIEEELGTPARQVAAWLHLAQRTNFGAIVPKFPKGRPVKKILTRAGDEALARLTRTLSE